MKHTFLILWLVGVVSTALGLPYIFALQQDVLAGLSMPLWQVGFIAIAQTALYLAIAVFVGLKLARRIGLPLSHYAGEKSSIYALRIAKVAVPSGVAIALFIRLADVFFLPHMPALAIAVERMPFWKALSVAPYGGVVEELLLRLFLVTLIAWLLGVVTRSTVVAQRAGIMWPAIIVASVVFGLGHLPATATLTPLTALVVFRAILLNGIGGIVFGRLYWKKGLEYAVAAHFTTDVVLHAVIPAVLS